MTYRCWYDCPLLAPCIAENWRYCPFEDSINFEEMYCGNCKHYKLCSQWITCPFNGKAAKKKREDFEEFMKIEAMLESL